MTGRTAVVALCGLLCTAHPLAEQRAPEDVTPVLLRQTQQLMDAVAVGDRGPWTRYLDDRMVYAAEDGTTKSKGELLAELRPLPKEIWGRLHVTRFRTVRHDDTAIANYIAEEDEGYFGQVIHARYLTTDTWKRTPAGCVSSRRRCSRSATIRPRLNCPTGSWTSTLARMR